MVVKEKLIKKNFSIDRTGYKTIQKVNELFNEKNNSFALRFILKYFDKNFNYQNFNS